MRLNLRREGCRPQNIRNTAMTGRAGQVQWTVGLFFLLFLAVILCAALQMELYRTAALYLEDALAASNLASAVVDLEEYGISHQILIKDPEAAYERYRQALRGNLNLDDAWNGQAGSLIQGAVRIVDYRVYNVSGGDVSIYRYDGNGVMTMESGILGSVAAPNGVLIESTSVYSEAAFRVRGLFGVEVEAHKGKLADIIR